MREISPKKTLKLNNLNFTEKSLRSMSVQGQNNIIMFQNKAKVLSKSPLK